MHAQANIEAVGGIAFYVPIRGGLDRRRARPGIGRHRLPSCPTTAKIRYRDKSQAFDGLKGLKRLRQQDEYGGVPSSRREIRVYRCRDCGGWHATSQELRSHLAAS